MAFLELKLRLPQWLEQHLSDSDHRYTTADDRMELVIKLSHLNVVHKTGGPFGAAIFDEQGLLIAPGVNLVEKSCCSIWHAEMVAIALAQTRLGRFDLGDDGKARFELVTSTEPCAMCFGAIPWSGVTGLVCGATEEDARNAGFDEGAKPSDWPWHLAARGITVQREVLRSQAATVLAQYGASGGTIYNPPTTRI
jgi:tRNA(Arg) A34 adenosine deaminase TadA